MTPEQKAKITADKQNRFEYMVERFQELIGKYDSLSMMFQKHVEKNGKDLEFVKYLSNDLDLLKRAHESLSAEIAQHKQSQSGLWTVAGNVSEKISKRIDDVQSMLKNQDMKHDQHLKSFQDMKQYLDDKVSKVRHADDVKSLQNGQSDLKASIQSNYEKHIALMGKVQSHDANLIDVKQEQGKQFNEVKALKELFLDVERQCKSALQEHKQKMDRDLITVASDMQKKLDTLPKPEKPDLSALKQDIVKQVEPAFLDAKNANLRSGNNEVKITILEKKIEQLQLLLNKLQLQG